MSAKIEEPKKLKRAVIKEELFVLLGRDTAEALILNQFLYWTKRMIDFDSFLAEEKKRIGHDLNVELTNGWIYKTAAELAIEIMVDKSEQTIRRKLASLVKKGYLKERRNPNNNWDRTLQYRVDLIKLTADLLVRGYALEGFSLPVTLLMAKLPNLQNGVSNHHNGASNLENGVSNHHNGASNLENGGTIPEITTEITTEITSERYNSLDILLLQRVAEKSIKRSLSKSEINQISEAVDENSWPAHRIYDAIFTLSANKSSITDTIAILDTARIIDKYTAIETPQLFWRLSQLEEYHEN